MIRRPPRSTRTDTLFPYTTLFRSDVIDRPEQIEDRRDKIALSRLEWKIEFPSLHRLAEILDEAVENLLNVKKRCWPTFLGETHAGPLGGPPIKRDKEVGCLIGPCRSEERRVGKERVSTCSTRCAPYHRNKQPTK